MALEDRAEAVTTVEDDPTEAPKGAPQTSRQGTTAWGTTARGDGPQSGNGQGEASDQGEADADGAGVTAAPSKRGKADRTHEAATTAATTDENGSAGANGTERPRGRMARKRTARQRTLLVTSAADELVEETAAAPAPAPAGGDPLLNGAGAAPATEDQRILAPPAPTFPAPDDRSATPALALIAAPTLPLVTVPAPLPVLAPEPDAQPQPGAAAASAPPTTVPAPPKPRRRARPRVRKVTRIVRSVDAWSVFKVALIFFLAMGVVLVTAGVLLWNLAESTGTLDNVEGFFQEAFNYDTFELESEPLFRALLTLTALFVVVGTGMSVVVAVLFNLISDLTGGIRVTVLEREVVARDDPRGRRRRRKKPRPAKRAKAASAPAAVAGRPSEAVVPMTTDPG